MQRLAIEAFRAIDAAGLARVDFLLARGSGEIYLNEINTMPGFTTISMYSKMWEASGLAYSALVDRLIQFALARHQEKQKPHEPARCEPSGCSLIVGAVCLWVSVP